MNKMTEKTIEEMRHEVIENGIKADNYIDHLIQLSIVGEEDLISDGKGSYIVGNQEQITLFYKHFLNDGKISFPRRIEFIKDSIKNTDFELYEGFYKDAERFRTIRNKFAHQIYPSTPIPEGKDKETREHIKKHFGWIKIKRKEFKDMYEEHCKLYKKLLDELSRVFYSNL